MNGTSVAAWGAFAGTADPGERGVTTIADKVIEKTAARAALEIPHAEGLGRRVVGREFGAQAIRVQVERDGETGSLRLELAVEYPVPVQAVTRAVRGHVRDRVNRFCGLTIDHVDITVTLLRRPGNDRRRVE